jgi:hypothetical protein
MAGGAIHPKQEKKAPMVKPMETKTEMTNSSVVPDP